MKNLLTAILLFILSSCSSLKLNRVSMREYYLHKQGRCSGSELVGHRPFLKPLPDIRKNTSLK